MLELQSTSRIGFGTYRASVDSSEHRQALAHALRNGCNLVDTAASYMSGKSEALVGAVTAEFPEFETFVITKGGYAQGADLKALEDLARRGMAHDGAVSISDESMYSIHPDFLRRQIGLSLERLRRPRLDAFLLHNPEHYFERRDATPSRDGYYRAIRRAIEFLEEMVQAGLVRCFGISSNTLPLSEDDPAATDIRHVLRIAEEVSARHHFRIVQFPFNLVEAGALRRRGCGSSLIDIARTSGLTTCANRPLNAKGPHGPLRLATYEAPETPFDEDDDAELLGECIERIQAQLRRIGSADDPMDFTVMQFLRDSWTRIGDPELVAQVFQGRLYPFLDRLYCGMIAEEDAAAFARLRHRAGAHARQASSRRALALRRELELAGALAPEDSRPLAVASAAYGLECGIDHVLVGMRRIEYVETLKSLF